MSLKTHLKTILRPLISKAVKNMYCWKLITFPIRFTNWLTYERSLFEHTGIEKKLRVYFKDMVVLSGPFRGLKYPGFISSGSSLYPKLLGCYESELHEILDQLISINYTEIIDVGCAEGYYAIGLAIRYQHSKVYAYDTNKEAQEMCHKMALLNQVENRILITGSLNAELLKTFIFKYRGLLIIDCEGYEDELFTKEVVGNLKNCDVLIELHPMYVEHIKDKIIQLFALTHHIEIISSQDTARKKFDNRNLLKTLSDSEASYCVEEGRPFTMEWVFAKSP